MLTDPPDIEVLPRPLLKLHPFALLCVLAFCITSCATAPMSTDDVAQAYDFETILVRGAPFTHVVYRKNFAKRPDETLHVYIGGDGSPWMDHRPATDPTPRNALTLRLMAKDLNDAVFIGRPCYHGQAKTSSCKPRLWTHARYSQEVVESMGQAINQQRISGGYDNVMLIGYSGGGVIATLLARDLSHLNAAVTIAANLDIDAWASHHGYETLSGSLNPAGQASIPRSVAQFHLSGGNDSVVPSATTAAYRNAHPQATYWLYPEFDHVCCWERDWAQTLGRIKRALSTDAH